MKTHFWICTLAAQVRSNFYSVRLISNETITSITFVKLSVALAGLSLDREQRIAIHTSRSKNNFVFKGKGGLMVCIVLRLSLAQPPPPEPTYRVGAHRLATRTGTWCTEGDFVAERRRVVNIMLATTRSSICEKSLSVCRRRPIGETLICMFHWSSGSNFNMYSFQFI